MKLRLMPTVEAFSLGHNPRCLSQSDWVDSTEAVDNLSSDRAREDHVHATNMATVGGKITSVAMVGWLDLSHGSSCG